MRSNNWCERPSSNLVPGAHLTLALKNGKGYQPQASADNPYLDLDYSGYHKNFIQQLLRINGFSMTVRKYITVQLFTS